MNHNFNLPKKSIAAIVKDNKPLLLRLDFPSNFDYRRDVLILTDEDSGIVWGTVKVATCTWHKDFFSFLIKHRKLIAHVQGSLLSYFGRKQGFFVMQVYSYQMFR